MDNLSLMTGDIQNAIDNSEGNLWQRTAGNAYNLNCADDTYAPDRWYALAQTGTIEVRQIAGPFGSGGSSRNAIVLKQSQASAQRMGIAQILRGVDSYGFNGQSLVIQGMIKCTGTPQVIKYALVPWISTEDVVVSDIVNSWTSGTYTAGNFFLSTTIGTMNVQSVTPTTSWLPFSANITPFGSNATNFILFLWTEATAPQNFEFMISQIDMFRGAATRAWNPRPSGLDKFITSGGAYATKMNRSAAQSIPNVTITKILLDTVEWTKGGMFDENLTVGDTANSRINIRRDGRYSIVAGVTTADLVSGKQCTVYVYVNGTQVSRARAFSASAGGDAIDPVLPDALNLLSGDYVELWANHDHGSAWNTLTGSGGVKPHLSVIEVQP